MSASSAPSVPVFSGEVAGRVDGCSNTAATRALADTLDDQWIARAVADGNDNLVRLDLPPLGSPAPPGVPAPLDFPATDVSVVVTKRGVTAAESASFAPGSWGSIEDGTDPHYQTSATLQDCAPRPASLYNSSSQPVFWNTRAGSGSTNDAALFQFSEPVRAFGAWFGDVETRTDGDGQPAYLKLFAADGSVLSVTPVPTDTADQTSCGGTSAASLSLCGNRATKWIGFTSTTADVASMLVIVGDDDSCTALPGECSGGSEHLSFVGPTLAYADALLTIDKATAAPAPSPGDTFAWTIDVANVGDASSAIPTVLDALPAGLTHVSSVGTGWTCDHTAGVVVCDHADLAGGMSAGTITITVQVDDPIAPGITEFANAAAVTDDIDTYVDFDTVPLATPPTTTLPATTTTGTSSTTSTPVSSTTTPVSSTTTTVPTSTTSPPSTTDAGPGTDVDATGNGQAVPPPSSLAYTGAGTAWLMVVAMVMIALGIPLARRSDRGD